MKKVYLVLILLLFVGCDPVNEISIKNFDSIVDFTVLDPSTGWKGGFSDCPEDTTGYNIKFSVENLPSSTEKSDEKGILLSGNNHSDDLWMFVSRKVAGLNPNTKYEGKMVLSLASKYLDGSVGIGGSPANSVYVKAGIVGKNAEHIAYQGNYIFNLDKGNKAQGGTELKVMGDVAISGSVEEYKLITRELDQYSFTTNEYGEAWIVVGFDSGFEGTSSIYFHSLTLNFAAK